MSEFKAAVEHLLYDGHEREGINALVNGMLKIKKARNQEYLIGIPEHEEPLLVLQYALLSRRDKIGNLIKVRAEVPRCASSMLMHMAGTGIAKLVAAKAMSVMDALQFILAAIQHAHLVSSMDGPILLTEQFLVQLAVQRPGEVLFAGHVVHPFVQLCEFRLYVVHDLLHGIASLFLHVRSPLKPNERLNVIKTFLQVAFIRHEDFLEGDMRQTLHSIIVELMLRAPMECVLDVVTFLVDMMPLYVLEYFPAPCVVPNETKTMPVPAQDNFFFISEAVKDVCDLITKRLEEASWERGRRKCPYDADVAFNKLTNLAWQMKWHVLALCVEVAEAGTLTNAAGSKLTMAHLMPLLQQSIRMADEQFWDLENSHEHPEIESDLGEVEDTVLILSWLLRLSYNQPTDVQYQLTDVLFHYTDNVTLNNAELHTSVAAIALSALVSMTPPGELDAIYGSIGLAWMTAKEMREYLIERFRRDVNIDTSDMKQLNEQLSNGGTTRCHMYRPRIVRVLSYGANVKWCFTSDPLTAAKQWAQELKILNDKEEQQYESHLSKKKQMRDGESFSYAAHQVLTIVGAMIVHPQTMRFTEAIAHLIEECLPWMPMLAPKLLPVLLYRVSPNYDNDEQVENSAIVSLLRLIPRVAIHVSSVVPTLHALAPLISETKSPLFRIGLHMFADLYKQHSRLFGKLQKLCHATFMAKPDVELRVTLGTIIHDVCDSNPHHGRDLLPLLVELLKDMHAGVRALALRSIHCLIRDEVIALADALVLVLHVDGVEMPSNYRCSTSGQVAMMVALLRLYAKVPQALINEDSRVTEKDHKEVIEVLWGYFVKSPHAEVRSQALNGLACYMEQSALREVPDTNAKAATLIFNFWNADRKRDLFARIAQVGENEQIEQFVNDSVMVSHVKNHMSHFPRLLQLLVAYEVKYRYTGAGFFENADDENDWLDANPDELKYVRSSPNASVIASAEQQTKDRQLKLGFVQLLAPLPGRVKSLFEQSSRSCLKTSLAAALLFFQAPPVRTLSDDATSMQRSKLILQQGQQYQSMFITLCQTPELIGSHALNGDPSFLACMELMAAKQVMHGWNSFMKRAVPAWLASKQESLMMSERKQSGNKKKTQTLKTKATAICTFFQVGKCLKGDTCRFSHVLDDGKSKTSMEAQAVEAMLKEVRQVTALKPESNLAYAATLLNLPDSVSKLMLEQEFDAVYERLEGYYLESTGNGHSIFVDVLVLGQLCTGLHITDTTRLKQAVNMLKSLLRGCLNDVELQADLNGIAGAAGIALSVVAGGLVEASTEGAVSDLDESVRVILLRGVTAALLRTWTELVKRQLSLQNGHMNWEDVNNDMMDPFASSSELEMHFDPEAVQLPYNVQLNCSEEGKMRDGPPLSYLFFMDACALSLHSVFPVLQKMQLYTSLRNMHGFFASIRTAFIQKQDEHYNGVVSECDLLLTSLVEAQYSLDIVGKSAVYAQAQDLTLSQPLLEPLTSVALSELTCFMQRNNLNDEASLVNDIFAEFIKHTNQASTKKQIVYALQGLAGLMQAGLFNASNMSAAFSVDEHTFRESESFRDNAAVIVKLVTQLVNHEDTEIAYVAALVLGNLAICHTVLRRDIDKQAVALANTAIWSVPTPTRTSLVRKMIYTMESLSQGTTEYKTEDMHRIFSGLLFALAGASTQVPVSSSLVQRAFKIPDPLVRIASVHYAITRSAVPKGADPTLVRLVWMFIDPGHFFALELQLQRLLLLRLPDIFSFVTLSNIETILSSIVRRVFAQDSPNAMLMLAALKGLTTAVDGPNSSPQVLECLEKFTTGSLFRAIPCPITSEENNADLELVFTTYLDLLARVLPLALHTQSVGGLECMAILGSNEQTTTPVPFSLRVKAFMIRCNMHIREIISLQDLAQAQLFLVGPQALADSRDTKKECEVLLLLFPILVKSLEQLSDTSRCTYILELIDLIFAADFPVLPLYLLALLVIRWTRTVVLGGDTIGNHVSTRILRMLGSCFGELLRQWPTSKRTVVLNRVMQLLNLWKGTDDDVDKNDADMVDVRASRTSLSSFILPIVIALKQDVARADVNRTGAFYRTIFPNMF